MKLKAAGSRSFHVWRGKLRQISRPFPTATIGRSLKYHLAFFASCGPWWQWSGVPYLGKKGRGAKVILNVSIGSKPRTIFYILIGAANKIKIFPSEES